MAKARDLTLDQGRTIIDVLDPATLGWLAGLLEGEGTFGNYRKGPSTAQVTISMTDGDIVRRVAAIFGVHVSVREPRSDPTHYGKKRIFRASIHGARAVALMEAVLPFMGERRAEAISAALARALPRLGMRGHWLSEERGRRHGNGKAT